MNAPKQQIRQKHRLNHQLIGWPPHTVLPNRGKKHNNNHKLPAPTRAQAEVTCNRSLHRPLDQFYPPRAESKTKKEFGLKAWRKETTNTINKKKRKGKDVLHKWKNKLEIHNTKKKKKNWRGNRQTVWKRIQNNDSKMFQKPQK